jgi:hypothetical protein
MLRMLLERLALVALLCFAGLSVLEHFNPTPPPLLVHAAATAAMQEAPYQTCKTPRVPTFLVHPTAKRIA